MHTFRDHDILRRFAKPSVAHERSFSELVIHMHRGPDSMISGSVSDFIKPDPHGLGHIIHMHHSDKKVSLPKDLRVCLTV